MLYMILLLVSLALALTSIGTSIIDDIVESIIDDNMASHTHNDCIMSYDMRWFHGYYH